MSMNKNLPIIGILGGMGPLATADFFYKLIRTINGEHDRDYNRIIMDCNSQIPDRIAALFQNGKDPVPELRKSIELLIDDGVDIIAVPCHTIYPFLAKIAGDYAVPILDMVSSMVNQIISLKINQIGILASQGTHRLQIYQKALAASGVQAVVLSDEKNRMLVDEVRLKVKRGDIGDETESLLLQAVEQVKELGAERAALCCSDLPIALRNPRSDVLDSNQIFAESVHRHALKIAAN